MGAVGPWAGVLLGQLGADVIKLELPQGDFIRVVMPAKRGLGTTYISMNFNKSGLVLDLKKPEDRAKAHELAAEADVFIENFRPGVADRIGVGYAELSKLNPRLIYASASGFGPKGPMVKIGATDPHLQPFTGSCSVNGEAGGKMQSWRWYGHFDCTTAMCITEGVLSALLERETTGRGKLIQVTMIEAAMALQRVRISEHLAGHDAEADGQRGHLSGARSGVRHQGPAARRHGELAPRVAALCARRSNVPSSPTTRASRAIPTA